MVISVSNTVKHPATCSKKVDLNDEKLKEVVFERFQKLGLSDEDVAWNEHVYYQAFHNPKYMLDFSVIIEEKYICVIHLFPWLPHHH